MGTACGRQKKGTIKIPIRAKTKQPEVEIPLEKFPSNQVQGQIGHFFQYQAECRKSLVLQKQKEWDSILDVQQVQFQGISFYKQLKNIEDQKIEENKQIEIVNFIELDQRDHSDLDTPCKPLSNTQTERKQRKSSQLTILEQLFKDGNCHLKKENEILMYIFSKQMPNEFNKLVRSDGQFGKFHNNEIKQVRFHNESDYDPNLYQSLLDQVAGSGELDINKDITRTFPKHPYFIQDEQGESIGQTQLFRVLKALSLHLPKVGYCQGMNFLAGFLLITNGGNDEEAFWFFKNLLESSQFMITGLFEVGFPLTNILTELFKQGFQTNMSALNTHFQDQFIPENLYVFKWFTTLFIYSFPFSVVYRLWDYIISKNILSLVSLSLAILENYQGYLIKCDIAEVSLFFNLIHDSELILTDQKSEVYLNIERVIDLAETKYQINYNSDDQGNSYAIGLSNMNPQKKPKVKERNEECIVENLS